jgi:CTP:molybdopterin cytidylyltransferase MocA/xanthine/CO dehydrogenase XdhC/CoxF family maturation factor
VLLERLEPDDPAAARLIELDAARIPALWLSDGRARACLAPGEAADLPTALRPAFEAALSDGVCAIAGDALFRRFDPPPRLVVIGADPPAMAMAALGATTGFETSLIRPKGPLAPPPIGAVRYLRSSPAEGLAQAGLDLWTCVAVATHDAELDAEALAFALRSDAGYVGVLGSKRRLPERLAGLKALGLTPAQIGRLKAPIGLALAGKSPWEIAVSVIAEMVQTLRAHEEAQGWPSPAPRLEGLVLAAGCGSRWGGGKLLADWRGAPLLHGALRAAFAAPVRSVFVVVGAGGEAVAASARAFAAAAGEAARLRIVEAPDWADGMSASIRRGVEALPADADGLLLFLGDMPAVPQAVLQPLADALAAAAPAAAPVHGDRRGHPVALSRALLPRLQALEGDRGAAAILAALGEALALIETADPGVCLDIDEPADLEAAATR